MVGAGLLAGLALGGIWLFGLPEGGGGGAAGSGEIGGSGALAGTSRAPSLPAPVEGAAAPDFALPDVSGGSVRLSSLRGKVVLLNFWATWCPPCEAEMPLLEEAHQTWGERGLVVLAVNFDEPEDEVGAFRDRLGLSIPLLLDQGGAVQELYQVRGYPTSFLIDRDGIVRVRHVGILSPDNLEDYWVEVGLTAP
jgi:cytochrome c biogenesis protein CcmG/thiol:disulfide interchange protein DsbE